MQGAFKRGKFMSEIKEKREKRKKEITKERKKKLVEYCTTGCDVLDLMLGGGLGWGRVINIVGDNSTGKSFICSELIAAARNRYGEKLKWFYDDAEAAYSFDTQGLYGFSITPEDVDDYSETVQEFDVSLYRAIEELKDDEYFIYVIDSLDALSSEEELDRKEEELKKIEAGKKTKGSYKMEKAKFLSEFFRTRRGLIKRKNCMLVVISQVRENIDAMFATAKYKRSGGKALDFYASQINWLAVTEKHKRKERIVGITVKVKNKKNKIGKPFRECYIPIFFDYGVDNTLSNICYLFDLYTPTGKIQKSKKFIFEEKSYTYKTFLEYVEENDLEEKIKKLVYAKWNSEEEEINTKKGRKRKYV